MIQNSVSSSAKKNSADDVLSEVTKMLATDVIVFIQVFGLHFKVEQSIKPSGKLKHAKIDWHQITFKRAL